jgi:ferritin-like metal-binding protein YciE
MKQAALPPAPRRTPAENVPQLSGRAGFLRMRITPAALDCGQHRPAPRHPISESVKLYVGGAMALFSMKMDNLQQLFIKELRDLYDAENQITEALPKLIEAAHHSELKSALQQHLQITKQQISRLDQIFQRLNQKATGETCKGMKGVIKEGDEMVSAGGDPSTVDAGIISAAQRVEHYEMAGYGTVRTYAQLLGQQEMARLLQQTLDEEAEADEKLTQIARSVNVEAKAA